ncbi:hypothetical protein ACFQZQ_07085 [Lysobacter koreensis]|uniref:Sulfotransferase family protein n=1 Tax=Lysobacter koreensis TaxID=266122 RepID=A0ABW2YLH8_9GAMM
MNRPSRLPPHFSASAEFFLFAFDPAQDRAWVLHFDREDYRRASFLDQRALHHRQIPGWEMPRAELEAALGRPASAPPVHWLFHIGHCGSTLLSRILDLAPGVLGLREPLPLLALAQSGEGVAGWFEPTLRLLARGFDDTQAVVVKPTSLVTTLAGPVLDRLPGQACLLWVDLQTWLATMLRDAGLCENALASEPLRLAALAEAGWPPAAGNGERLARLWLGEQLRWRQLARDPDKARRLLDLDFATVLDDPAATSARLLAHFGLQAPPDWAQRITASGLLTHYAKDGTQDFDAHTRRHELDAAAAAHRDAIAGGMIWAERAITLLGAGELTPRLRPRD